MMLLRPTTLMVFGTLYRVILAAVLTFSLPAQGAEPITRVANETLRLPRELPTGSFKTENAFPNLTFSRPLALVTPPGEENRLFIVEQAGVISVIPNLDQPAKETFLDLSDVTQRQGESGLLGLAFHPHYAANGYFYVFYSLRIDGQLVQRVARFEADPNQPNRARRDSEMPMIDQRDDASNHNGGDLHFGPDGYLYITFGDEGGANDRFGNSRVIDRGFFAAIARIDVDQRPGSLPPNEHPGVYPDTYTIPPDNPFLERTAFLGRPVDTDKLRTEFWAVGLRNPWRMAFDMPTGRLFFGDVGQDAREEINLIERGGHYGWSYREGTRRFTGAPGSSDEPQSLAPTEPLWDYGRQDGISVTGGVVYRGQAHTELYQAYIFGDFGSGLIWAMHFDDDGSVRVVKVAEEERDEISAFGTDPRNGDILYAAHGAGQIKRIARRSSGFTLLIPSTLSRTGAFADLETLTPNEGIVAYEPNVSFWSDGAVKRRWFTVPKLEDVIDFAPEEPWAFPAGTTWIKHFEVELEPGNPASRRRVETRFLVKTETASYGLTYAWNEDETEAAVVPSEGAETTFTVQSDAGPVTRTWSFPSRNACRACHTRVAGHALSFHTAQLNRRHDYPEGSVNQLKALADAGYFQEPLSHEPENLPRLVPVGDTSFPLEDRARAYLEANCAQCHQKDGPALGFWDARAHLSLEETGLVDGPLVNDFGEPSYRVISPREPERSMILTRLAHEEGFPKMPPLGSNLVDEAGLALLRQWVLSLDRERLTAFDTWMAGFDTADSGLHADPDRDGLSNGQEYLAGTDPTRSVERWMPQVVTENERRLLIVPPVVNGALDFQRSDDAQIWTSWQPVAQATETLVDGTRRIWLGSLARRQFYRFRLLGID